MIKLSDLVSKKLYSLYEGVFVGTIISSEVNFARLKGVYVLSTDEENIYFLPCKDFCFLGTDIVSIKNTDKLKNQELIDNSLLNKDLISLKGESLGIINDIFFDDKYNIIAFKSSLNVVVPISLLVHIGKDAVFFGEDDIKINKMKPKKVFNFNINDDYKVSILENKLSKIEGEEQRIPLLPQKLKQNPSFLIGRTVNEVVKTELGEVIIKQGQKITEKVISKAQLSNKIYELSKCVN